MTIYKNMEAITIHPKNKEQLEAITSVLKVLKIPFKKEESPYDPEFVKMIQEAEKNREGSIILLESKEDLDKYFESLEKDVQV
jgi:flagellar motor component MotA